LAVLSLALAPQADASQIAITGLGSGYTPAFSVDSTSGWSFTAHSNLLVTELGVWDQGSNGLNHDHDVGLWTAGGVLLGSLNVAAGTTAPLVSGFRYQTLSSAIALSAGAQYVIGASYLDVTQGPDPILQAASFVNTDPAITWVEAHRFQDLGNLHPGLQFPTALGNDEKSFFGPNFRFTVPEPTVAALVAVGLLGIGLRRRR
jgi:hypothetical protein